jgi:hypothetical protein
MNLRNEGTIEARFSAYVQGFRAYWGTLTGSARYAIIARA